MRFNKVPVGQPQTGSVESRESDVSQWTLIIILSAADNREFETSRHESC